MKKEPLDFPWQVVNAFRSFTICYSRPYANGVGVKVTIIKSTPFLLYSKLLSADRNYYKHHKMLEPAKAEVFMGRRKTSGDKKEPCDRTSSLSIKILRVTVQ